MKLQKVQEADLVGKGVVGLPDEPGLSTQQMQEKFEEIVRDVVIPVVNHNAEYAVCIDHYTTRALLEQLADDKREGAKLNADTLGGTDAENFVRKENLTSGALAVKKAEQADNAENAAALGGLAAVQYARVADLTAGIVQPAKTTDAEKLGGNPASEYALRQDITDGALMAGKAKTANALGKNSAAYYERKVETLERLASRQHISTENFSGDAILNMRLTNGTLAIEWYQTGPIAG